jgi:Protein of unknown function, DUF481
VNIASIPSLIPHRRHAVRLLVIAGALAAGLSAAAQAKPAPNPAPDVLVLSDGDTLHGKFVNEIGGKITFHTESLGDVALTWDKIKELHTAELFTVLDKTAKLRGKGLVRSLPSGTLDVTGHAVTVQPSAGPPAPPIPVANAAYIIDQPTLEKEIYHQPSVLAGWNGSATAGATLVSATQNQYTVSGAVGLVRVVPSVSWLNSRDRTSFDFSGSFGRINQPAYTIPASGATPATPVAAENIKSSITHFDAERDEYFSPRVYALGQAAFDHNFSQDLGLQQIYGGGVGWTVVKDTKQSMDLKGTIQYEKQSFLTEPGGTPSPDQNLVGSTFAADYLLHVKLFTLTQVLGFIPAYNTPSAYSATETDTFAFPAYKNLSFSVGTLDTYLNDPPPGAEPPAKRNSFQFTMGFAYAIKSKE